ncbi:hypothetical protein AMEX_G19672 [Astyanax mexicanus]|uniref:Uncharacterized protein n=1 Tax=Astyanax mexicanus TaxID=7994 RepID=A0A8T2L5L9_ASTMX|nr:hypothetical protein AMEX_G19672 [Astyanax mexicanus]
MKYHNKSDCSSLLTVRSSQTGWEFNSIARFLPLPLSVLLPVTSQRGNASWVCFLNQAGLGHGGRSRHERP